MDDRRFAPSYQLSEADWPGLLQALRDGAVVLASTLEGMATAPFPRTPEALERELAIIDAMWEGGRVHGNIRAEDLAALEERRALLRRRMLRVG